MKPTIIFCLPGSTFSGKFLQCWTDLLYTLTKNDYKVILSQKSNSNVYYVRTICLGADVRRGIKQVPFGGTIHYDYLMWIDSDVIFKPDDFFKLLNHDKDIVGGVYPMEDEFSYPVVIDFDTQYFLENGSFQFLNKNTIDTVKRTPEGLIDVTYTGFGFLLMKYGVIERIPYPWFEPQTFAVENSYIKDFCSEDVSFCLNAKNAGFSILIDPTVRVGHLKERILT